MKIHSTAIPHPQRAMTRFGRAMFALACVAAGISGSSLKAAEKPNIVVFFVDDMGYGDLQANNAGAKTHTPCLDHLAAEGIRFTDGHACSSLCSPSRYGLLTGRYAWRTSLKAGVLSENSPLLIETNCDTLASMLKRNGYRTAIVGKWHLGLGKTKDLTAKFSAAPEGLKPGPNECGFDFSYILPASLNMAPSCYLKNLQPVSGVDDSASPPFAQWRTMKSNGSYPKPLGYDAGRIAPGFDPNFDANPSATPRFNKVVPHLTDEAVSCVKDQAARHDDQPLFLYFALPSPHTPWVPDIDTTGMSKEQLYIAYVNETDAAVGRVVDALKQNGLWQNTLVFFSSDNGPELRPFNVAEAGYSPAGQLRGEKSDLYEGGHREPFIVTWPGHLPAGSTSGLLISTLDFYRTFATLVGDHRPAGMIGGEDSLDFSKLFLGGHMDQPLRTELVNHSGHGRFAIRIGDWEYLDWAGSGGYVMPDSNPEGTPGQLFNVANDPSEKHNVYSAYPERVAEMKAALIKIQGPDAPALSKTKTPAIEPNKHSREESNQAD
jgi:arylsulfatase A